MDKKMMIWIHSTQEAKRDPEIFLFLPKVKISIMTLKRNKNKQLNRRSHKLNRKVKAFSDS